MKLSIIIVNFNTSKFLQNCLESVYQNAGNLDLEVIVIDNASTEELSLPARFAELRRARTAGIKLIKNKKNVGFAAANNQGIKQTAGEYVLLLNPDTLIQGKVLTYMVNFMEQNPKVGIATCRVNLMNGQLDDACHRGFPTPWNAFCYFTGIGKIFPKSKFLNGYHLGFCRLDKIHQIDACAGAFMLIRREAGENLSWLDEDYFWYGEDLDFCFRAKVAGWKVMFVPDVQIRHFKGVAGGIKKHSQHITTANRNIQLFATKARFEVMRIFYRKHYQNKYPGWLTWLVIKAIKIKENLSLLKYK